MNTQSLKQDYQERIVPALCFNQRIWLYYNHASATSRKDRA